MSEDLVESCYAVPVANHALSLALGRVCMSPLGYSSGAGGQQLGETDHLGSQDSRCPPGGCAVFALAVIPAYFGNSER